MAVSLSVKNVPDALAERLRARAERNRRSLQRELLLILERAAQEGPTGTAAGSGLTGAGLTDSGPAATGPDSGRISIEQLATRARQLFPKGTTSSVAFIRQQREERLAAASSGARRRGR